MADIMQSGIAWLAGQLKEFASELVTIVRGYQSVDVQAVLGKQLLKLDDGLGNVRMEYTDMDFGIASVDYDFGAGPVTPERGDLIYRDIAYDTQTFEVSPYGTEPAWRFSDPYQTMLRIHTKEIESEPYS